MFVLVFSAATYHVGKLVIFPYYGSLSIKMMELGIVVTLIMLEKAAQKHGAAMAGLKT